MLPAPENPPIPARRILIAGLASEWGGRLARTLEKDPEIETIVGIDTADPGYELERTEFVRTETDPGRVVRIIRAAQIDTIVYVNLVPDTVPVAPAPRSGRGVAGLRRLLSAAAVTDVARLVVKSSAEVYGSGRDAPAFFTEEMPIDGSPQTAAQRGLLQAETLLAEFAGEHPQRTVTSLRCALVTGPGLSTAHLRLLGLPAIPAILGFDPRWQFVHADDVVASLAHAVHAVVPGAYNLAGDGVLALSEVAGLLDKPLVPLLPPWGTLFTARQARRLRLPVPLGMLRDLRYGRGVDNRRLKATGFSLRYTSREAVLKLLAEQRLRPLLAGDEDRYRYEPEVEDFLRRSPSVQTRPDPASGPGPAPSEAGSPGGPADRLGPPGTVGDSPLTQDELLEIIPSLETSAMLRLREHEAAGPRRDAVLEEIDHQLQLRTQMDPG